MEYQTLYNQICRVVQEAGELIRPLSEITEVTAKEGSANFVTTYDSRVQTFLMEKLTFLVPDAIFVCEEDGCSSNKVGSGPAFIIDPIDGTTNFICNFQFSGISVAFADQGEVKIGIVYNPFRNEFFSALRGAGAFLNKQPLAVRDCSLRESVLCVDTAPYTPELRENTFKRILLLSDHCLDIRSLGSAALAICYVACGRASAYISPNLCVWDYAAASLILSETGGKTTGEFGEELCFSTHVPVTAATSRALDEILTILKR